ncbi:MAG: TIGR04282 family arsenosugar biosynthesis glycosyltransferase [Acidobacteria bacterium]|nr:TIGR04282 family arsenosugar biosynthesis glycosyltransferase [Acidobacteriota bacterium]
MRGSLLIYTKPGRPGFVKTRLIGALTPEEAAELHLAFLGDLVDEMAAGDFELRLAWALEVGEVAPAWPTPTGTVAGMAQAGVGLGERLWRGLEAAARDHELVAAVGSDHPTLRRDTVEQAFELLEGGAPVVLGPAADGGYFLVATSRQHLTRRIFEDVPWSTDRVLETTLERCRGLGLEPALLPRGHDVDTPEDLERLVVELRRRPDLCPRTRERLAAWGFLDGRRSAREETRCES